MLRKFWGLLFFLFSSHAQSQPIFNKIYDFGLPINTFWHLMVDNDTIICYGNARDSAIPSPQHLLIVQMDSSGNVLNHKLLKDSLNDFLSVDETWGGMIKTSDDCYIFPAVALGRGANLLIRLDKNLETKSIFEFDDTVDYAQFYDDVIELHDGGFLISGRLTRPNNKKDAFLRRVNKLGNTLWHKYYGNYDENEGFFAMVKMTDNRFMLGGYSSLSSTNPSQIIAQIWVVDTSGNVLDIWKAPAVSDLVVINNLSPTNDGGLIALGRTYLGEGPWGSKVQTTIMKFDSTFQVEWIKQVGPSSSGYNAFNDLIATFDSSFIAVGQRTQYGNLLQPSDDWGGWMFKFSLNGDSIWSRADHAPLPYSSTGAFIYGGVDVFSSGSVVAGGKGDANNTFVGWVVKVTADGCLDTLFCNTVSVVEPPAAKDDFLKVWPNPASDFINIEVPGFSEVEFLLYDSQGRAVRRGKFVGQAALPSASLPEGFYFLEISAGRQVVARQKIIIAH
jgi:hypothetical protein